MMIYLVTDEAGTILKSGYVPDEETASIQGADGRVMIMTGDSPVMLSDTDVQVVDGCFSVIEGRQVTGLDRVGLRSLARD